MFPEKTSRIERAEKPCSWGAPLWPPFLTAHSGECHKTAPGTLMGDWAGYRQQN